MLNPSPATSIPLETVTFVKELYPRLREDDAAIERYRAALDNLPPIIIARGHILVDGFHRLKAHEREGAKEINAIDIGNLADAEIVRESISRNATHGHQLSQADKKRLAHELWIKHFAAMPSAERITEIRTLLSISRDTVERWTKDARKAEKEALQARAWDLWLDCWSEREIAEQIGVTHPTISEWLDGKKSANAENLPPVSLQHFDVWNFPKADNETSYFGRMPAQVMENLLWFFTKPGDIVVDLFAGSGTTIDVAKAMGRRVWASDLKPSTPNLPIYQHDAVSGWPKDAPRRADLIVLDPPYWQQAKERYSKSPHDLGNVTLNEFYAAWAKVIAYCKSHINDGARIAYIISPSGTDDGSVVYDHATDMLAACRENGLKVERRIIVPYQTQQVTGQHVEWARAHRCMLKLYRDLIVVSTP